MPEHPNANDELATTTEPNKLRLAVWKFASCDGCQLSVLDCEDELLTLTEHLEIAHFPEASRRILPPPYDLSLVEGSVSAPGDIERLERIRAQSHLLVTIGACATAGGIQSLRNYANVSDYVHTVYAHPEFIQTLDKVSPIAAHVHVDLELRGCPINKQQLLELINALLNARKPNLSQDSVCTECKAQQVGCLMVSEQQPCLGPVTHAGCKALCPRYGRACFGCYGPKATVNTASLADAFLEQGMPAQKISQLFRTYNATSEAFHKESVRQESHSAKRIPIHQNGEPQ